MNSSGKLYIVPTPIGNLRDITLRAIDILSQCDKVLAEDTRTAHVLLKHYNIHTPTQSYHQNNEHKVAPHCIDELKSGKTIALISDAGTPAISDPGYLLVRQCIDNDIAIEILPGATAFVPALVGSGFPMHQFIFEGFLPQQKGRMTKISAIFNSQCTCICYESPHRLLKFLEQALSLGFGEREICIVREISKIYETFHRGKVSSLAEYFTQNAPKGEIVIVIKSMY
jgi:16S rRNA (cytidine1402-2'-O)-methyltransferase